ncbi:MAG: hypothetical protein ACFFD7_01705 [Candidatus Thorarchaeota archaeon]
MAKVEIHCPICTKWANIEILEDAAKNVKKGLLAVNIEPGMICEHSFIAYVDKNLIVRDCFIADFKIETPEVILTQQDTNNDSLTEPEDIRIDLIKMNIPEKLMIFVFKAIFARKKIVVLSENHFLYIHLMAFLKFIIRDLFDFDLIFVSEQSYDKSMNEYEDYVVFKKSDILHDKDNIIESKKLSVEKSIVKKFLAEYEFSTGLIILRNEFQKAYEFSKQLANYISNNQEESFTSKILIEYVNEKQNDRINKDYLNFLLNIVLHHFNVEIPKISGMLNIRGYF